MSKKWCKICKEMKPESEFLRVPRGWRVNGCNSCVTAKMASYWRAIREAGPDPTKWRGMQDK